MKNYHKPTIKAILGLLLISMPMWSCKKFIDSKPDNLILTEFIFDNDATVNAALNGAYLRFSSNISADFLDPAMYADELTSPSVSNQIKYNNTYTPTFDPGFFRKYYTAILETNQLLEGIDGAPNISASTKAIVKGEALFLRAFSYFQLVNYYGPVPYIITSNSNVSAKLPNTPVATTNQNIMADLNTSAGLLTNTYPAGIRTRANKQVVNALLAKAYLYTNDWVNAANTASLVINSGLYSINSNLNSVFYNNSNETIFQLYNTNGVILGNVFGQASATQTISYPVRPELVNAFGTGDQRKGIWIKPGTISLGVPSSQYIVTKYMKMSQTDGLPEEYAILFRLGEMYLIRAEALAQQNTPSSITAGATDLQVTRNRAGLVTPLTITTSAQLLTAVADERRKELSFEFANRWFDLKRTGQALAALQPLKPGIDAHILLLPFFQNDRNYNQNLVQNPGY